MIKKLLAASLLLALGVAYADSQSTAFTYQGNLTANGGPANANLDMTFTLFDAQTAGNQVGATQSISQFPVVNGRFTVDLDFPGVFKGTQLWLEVAVGGQTLSPRQSVNSVPVAQYALSSAPEEAWSSIIVLPNNPSFVYGSPTGFNSPTSGTESAGLASYQQAPQNCTVGNLLVTAFGAQGTSSALVLVGKSTAATIAVSYANEAFCTITANNGAIVSCSAQTGTGDSVAQGTFLFDLVTNFTNAADFNNAKFAFSFTCK